jgi:hypothetical protein
MIPRWLSVWSITIRSTVIRTHIYIDIGTPEYCKLTLVVYQLDRPRSVLVGQTYYELKERSEAKPMGPTAKSNDVSSTKSV